MRLRSHVTLSPSWPKPWASAEPLRSRCSAPRSRLRADRRPSSCSSRPSPPAGLPPRAWGAAPGDPRLARAAPPAPLHVEERALQATVGRRGAAGLARAARVGTSLALAQGVCPAATTCNARTRGAAPSSSGIAWSAIGKTTTARRTFAATWRWVAARLAAIASRPATTGGSATQSSRRASHVPSTSSV